MKNLISAFILAAVAVPSYAGVFRHVVKPAAKVVSFPVVHPKKSVKAVGHGVKKAVW